MRSEVDTPDTLRAIGSYVENSDVAFASRVEVACEVVARLQLPEFGLVSEVRNCIDLAKYIEFWCFGGLSKPHGEWKLLRYGEHDKLVFVRCITYRNFPVRMR